MILSFRTDRSKQTVQTQIRLLLEEQSDQGLHCLLFHLHRFDKIPLFLAHLSQRLIGELIVYQWSGVRHPSSVRRRRRPQCSNIFFSETAWPIKAKFYVEPPWVGGTIFCLGHLGHMTKMAAFPIYGKNPSKIFFSRTGGPIFTKVGTVKREIFALCNIRGISRLTVYREN